MNHKDNRRVKLTKQLIRDSFLELLQTQELHRVSVRALCERAEINRSTFYKYYDSTYALLSDMEKELLTEISSSLCAMTEPANDVKKMVQLLRFLRAHLPLCRMLLNTNVDPDFSRRLLSLPSITDKLRAGFEGEPTRAAVYVQEFVLYGAYQVILRWINDDCPETPEEIAALIYETSQKVRPTST